MLLKFGKGQIMSNNNRYIDTIIVGHTISCSDDLCSAVYSNLTTEYINPNRLRNNVVLAPTNSAIDILNYDLLSQQLSQKCYYWAADTIADLNQLTHLPTKFLNS